MKIPTIKLKIPTIKLKTYLIMITDTDALNLGADVVYYLSQHCCHLLPVRSTEHMSHDREWGPARDLCDQAMLQPHTPQNTTS